MSTHSRRQIGPGANSGSSDLVPGGERPVEHEQPEDWGWHHQWKTSTPVVGVVCTILMLLLIFGNNRGGTSTLYLIGFAAVMAAMLTGMRIRRKNSWRD